MLSCRVGEEEELLEGLEDFFLSLALVFPLESLDFPMLNLEEMGRMRLPKAALGLVAAVCGGEGRGDLTPGDSPELV